MSNRILEWSPSSWRVFPTSHQPSFADQEQLAATLATINGLPPLVHAADVERLKRHLCSVSRNEAVILQGGNCAETFADCSEERVKLQLKTMGRMGTVISGVLGKPTVKIGRIAGQYAKPRSAETEIIQGREVLTFRGENINGFDPEHREPNPRRLMRAYFYAATTINFLNSLMKNSWGALSQLSPAELEQCQLASKTFHHVEKNQIESDFFTSHEALYLAYEQRCTRFEPEYGGWYNLSAHMLWIGERTTRISGGHVEYARGIANPIGLKIGPSSHVNEMIAIINKLNPQNVAGKIILITRMGKDRVEKLRDLVTAVNDAKLNVIWLCDPMHGNTCVAAGGRKIRVMDDMTAELAATNRLHTAHGNTLHGLHLELTGEDVTECVGGSRPVHIENIADNYLSKCDPRLNYSQALDMALHFGLFQCASKEKNL